MTPHLLHMQLQHIKNNYDDRVPAQSAKQSLDSCARILLLPRRGFARAISGRTLVRPCQSRRAHVSSDCSGGGQTVFGPRILALLVFGPTQKYLRKDVVASDIESGTCL